MAVLQDIERRIEELSPSGFQQLCDAYFAIDITSVMALANVSIMRGMRLKQLWLMVRKLDFKRSILEKK